MHIEITATPMHTMITLVVIAVTSEGSTCSVCDLVQTRRLNFRAIQWGVTTTNYPKKNSIDFDNVNTDYFLCFRKIFTLKEMVRNHIFTQLERSHKL